MQGPPGTGKTHTIANLVSAYLAEGKRILVTSQKDQALRESAIRCPGSCGTYVSCSRESSAAAALTRWNGASLLYLTR